MNRPRSALPLFGLLASAALLTSGCFAWRFAEDPPSVVVATSPDRLWVPVTGDSGVVLLAPRLSHDTLTGLIEGSAEPGERLATFAKPLSEIPRVATEHLDLGWGARHVSPNFIGRTALLAAIILGTLGYGSYIRGGAQ